MSTLPNDIISSEEIIKNWTCRENGAIFIPKVDRERAFLIQVDIKIVSVARYQYLNYETSPPDSYYGYATLVMRDYALPPIKLSQPRQTIYLEKNYDAIDCWHQYFRAIEQQPRFEGIETLICGVVGQLGGACVAKDCVPIKPPPFIELPLREVYVNCPIGTQFQIELSYWRFLDLVDNCGNLVPFKSGQTDSEKDSGLPANGTLPAMSANGQDPYAGLPDASTVSGSDLGLLPSGKQDNLNDVNPDNEPIQGSLFWLEFRAPRTAQGFAPACSTRYSKVIIAIPSLSTEYDIHFDKIGTECSGIDYGEYTFYVSGTTEVLGTAGYLSAQGGTIQYHSGDAYPDAVYYSETPV